VSPLKTRTLLAVVAVTAVVAVWAVPVEARPGHPSFTTACGITNVSTGATRCTYTFRYTQTIETFIVPPTTEPIQITAVGAPGGGDPGFRSRGASVTGSFSHLSGMPIFVTVGGEGWFDGYNGGAGGGGGASDVRLGLPRLDRRIIIAGGGGGWGEQLVFDQSVGLHRFMLVRGGDAGQPGFGAGGAPGTATAGGDGGGTEPARGKPGILGQGGAGGEGLAGGGGGGLFGGGGGGGCSGDRDGNGKPCLDSQPGSGGGGSSLVPPGGRLALSSDFEPRVVITVIRYGWWGVP
jgi:hypothetical protein